MIDRLDGIKRDKEIKCTRIGQPSLPFVQINTRYACNYARASNFVCALLKRFDFLCHRIFQSFSPRRDKIKIGSCLCNALIVNEFHPSLKYPVHHRCEINFRSLHSDVKNNESKMKNFSYMRFTLYKMNIKSQLFNLI